MAVNIFATSYKPATYMEIATFDDDIIRSLHTIARKDIFLINSIDPYDNTFLNKKQIKLLEAELSLILIENFKLPAIQKITQFKETINIIFQTNSTYHYLLFLGD